MPQSRWFANKNPRTEEDDDKSGTAHRWPGLPKEEKDNSTRYGDSFVEYFEALLDVCDLCNNEINKPFDLTELVKGEWDESTAYMPRRLRNYGDITFEDKNIHEAKLTSIGLGKVKGLRKLLKNEKLRGSDQD